ncbi:hypothetical protein BSKO_13265 [Bryopsis sp. KO-2023]|nr:hypothetical protein BSKO_13265 [Bryopsis sp. KO-2023]
MPGFPLCGIDVFLLSGLCFSWIWTCCGASRDLRALEMRIASMSDKFLEGKSHFQELSIGDVHPSRSLAGAGFSNFPNSSEFPDFLEDSSSPNLPEDSSFPEASDLPNSNSEASDLPNSNSEASNLPNSNSEDSNNSRSFVEEADLANIFQDAGFDVVFSPSPPSEAVDAPGLSDFPHTAEPPDESEFLGAPGSSSDTLDEAEAPDWEKYLEDSVDPIDYSPQYDGWHHWSDDSDKAQTPIPIIVVSMFAGTMVVCTAVSIFHRVEVSRLRNAALRGDTPTTPQVAADEPPPPPALGTPVSDYIYGVPRTPLSHAYPTGSRGCGPGLSSEENPDAEAGNLTPAGENSANDGQDDE